MKVKKIIVLVELDSGEVRPVLSDINPKLITRLLADEEGKLAVGEPVEGISIESNRDRDNQ